MSLFAREPRIEASLLERRDDAREWAVYADWLEANGSPRGALASLMLRRETNPTWAFADALKAHAGLLGDLTPEPLKTLATRGHPRLAPVFRHGFIHSAGAADAADFSTLVQHPSCALLDVALLAPANTDELEAWFETLNAPLPWRQVEVIIDADAVSLRKLLARCPRLERLKLVAWNPPEELDLAGLKCPHVIFEGASPPMLRALVESRAPVKRLELRRTREEDAGQREDGELDELVDAFLPLWRQLDEVVLEGSVGENTRRACLAGARPRRLVVRTPAPSAESFTVPLSRSEEISFALFNRPLTDADHQVIADYAKLAGVSRLVLHTREVPLARRTGTLLRPHGTGDAPLVARVIAQQLVKTDRALDAVAITVSVSNDVTSAWSFGPHVARADTPKKSIPISRREEGRFTRAQMVRELCESLAGFDPGLDVLDEWIAALDQPEVRTVLGDAPRPGEDVPMFTDFAANQPEPDADEDEDFDEDEYEDDDEEFDPVDRRDAMAHQVDADREREARWYYDDEFENPWGAAPQNVPDYGPLPVKEVEPAVIVGASLKPTANALDDDPSDDLDEPLHDAWSANEEEVWSEGPVDLPEHHQVPIGEVFDEPTELPNGSYLPDAAPCAHCTQHRETARCSQCRDEVCRECAGPKSTAAWDDGRDFICKQCSPASTGKFVAVRRVRPASTRNK